MSRQWFKAMRLLIVVAMLVTAVVVQIRQPSQALDDPTYWPTNGWQTSTPEEQGMDSAELAGFVQFVADPTFYIDGLVVVRHGYIVAEAYNDPVTMTDLHHMYSASKSVTSMLYGMALAEGLVPPIDTPVLEAFPNTFENVDAMKEAMTIRDLLTMGSGLYCDGLDPAVMEPGAYVSNVDWVQDIGSMPMWVEPGTEFHYCDPNTTLLAGLINEGTGMSALEYAQQNLFAPLGITEATWTADQQNVNYGSSELRLTARDMAKLGLLMVHDGRWDEQQIIPADWAVASRTTQMVTPYSEIGIDYGYQWWYFRDLNMSVALGYGGQYIMVLPDKDLVVVTTSGATDPIRVSHSGFPIWLTVGGLTTSDAPLPANDAAVTALNQALAALTAPEPSVPVLPEMAATVSGQSYSLLNPNLFRSPAEFIYTYFRFPAGADMTYLYTPTLALTFSETEASLTVTYLDGEVAVMPIGLDGLYRRSEQRQGVTGAKGEWRDADTFRLYLKQVDDVVEYRMDFSFTQELLEIMVFESGGGEGYAILGTMAQ